MEHAQLYALRVHAKQNLIVKISAGQFAYRWVQVEKKEKNCI